MVRLKKKKEEKNEHEGLDEALEEIEGWGDKLVEWVSTNPVIVMSVIGGVLLVAGVIGGSIHYGKSKEVRASAALANLERQYEEEAGLGADLTGTSLLVNPDAGRQLRESYAAQFVESAKEHKGTTAAVMALFEAGLLDVENGNLESAVQRWEMALEQSSGNSELQALILARTAVVYEDLGRWKDAGKAYEEVAAKSGTHDPNRLQADAARCYAEAGDDEAAGSLVQEIEGRGGFEELPPHLKVVLEKYRA